MTKLMKTENVKLGTNFSRVLKVQNFWNTEFLYFLNWQIKHLKPKKIFFLHFFCPIEHAFLKIFMEAYRSEKVLQTEQRLPLARLHAKFILMSKSNSEWTDREYAKHKNSIYFQQRGGVGDNNMTTIRNEKITNKSRKTNE